MKILKFFLLIILLIILGLGYLGFVPGLSTIMAANKPKDLGVTYSDQDFQNIIQKAGVSYQDLPSETDLINSAQYEGSHQANLDYSSAELTALVNSTHWKYNPFSNVQIKINQDGSTEISGNINLNKLWDYAVTNGVSTSDIEQAKKALTAIPSQPAFYAKGTVSAENNHISNLNIDSLSIGRLAVPASIIQPNQHYLADMANKEMNSIPGFYAQSVSAENGQVKFNGTLPDVEKIVRQ